MLKKYKINRSIKKKNTFGFQSFFFFFFFLLKNIKNTENIKFNE